MGKLDQSLDEIVSTQRSSARRGGRGRRTGVVKAPPTGGVKKATRAAQSATKKVVTPTGPAARSGDSKIIVSNLPVDVKEAEIKEYFSKSVGPVKKVLLTYGPNGQSRGVATIIFNKGDSANKALKECNGLLVDNRAIKVEVVLDASRAPASAQAKALKERVSQAKSQPKSAAAPKAATNGTTAARKTTRGRARGRGRGGAARKPKTIEQLDAEMEDYMDPNAAAVDSGAVANGTAQPAAAAGAVDAGMDDEIS